MSSRSSHTSSRAARLAASSPNTSDVTPEVADRVDEAAVEPASSEDAGVVDHPEEPEAAQDAEPPELFEPDPSYRTGNLALELRKLQARDSARPSVQKRRSQPEEGSASLWES